MKKHKIIGNIFVKRNN